MDTYVYLNIIIILSFTSIGDKKFKVLILSSDSNRVNCDYYLLIYYIFTLQQNIHTSLIDLSNVTIQVNAH